MRGGRLGVDLAPLQAEPAVDAVGPVAEAAVGDRHRPDPGLDSQDPGTALEHLAVARDLVGGLGIPVRVPPRPVLPRHGQLGLDLLVERPHVLIADGPVRPHPVPGADREVARVEPRHVAGIVNHGAADAAPGVVGAQRHRVVSGDDARFCPVQMVRARLVADPVGLRIPERPGVQRHDPPPGASQPLREHPATGAAADHDQVDLVGVLETPHVVAQAVVQPPARGEQPRRFVAGPRAGVKALHVVQFWAGARPDSDAESAAVGTRVGSRSGRASATSNGSRRSTPRFL